ncbi:MAG: hypothetical protein DRJ03_16215 [Chloroflexi bacterium]|nr:MAG: hypothetical protein DRJ03_16215 [Chloroflexota bacterium]
MDFETITSTTQITTTTGYAITVQPTGDSIVYQHTVTMGDVLILAPLWALAIFHVYSRIMLTLRGR